MLISLFLPPRPKKKLPDSIESILIIAQDKIGDFILLTPVLYSLDKYFPGIEITVITTRHNYELCKSISFIKECITPNILSSEIKKRVLDKHYTMLFNPKDHISRSALIFTAKIKADFKVGFDDFCNRKFYDILLKNDKNQSIIEKNMMLLSMFTKPVANDYLPKIPDSSTFSLPGSFKNLSKPVIGLNVSAGLKLREWKLAHWVKFIEEFSFDNINFVLIGLPDKSDLIISLIKRFNNCTGYYDLPGILEVNSFIKHLDYMITPDTAIFHLAQMNNIKTIALFQNRQLNLKRYYRDNDFTKCFVSSDVDINNIDTKEVALALRTLLIEDGYEDCLSK